MCGALRLSQVAGVLGLVVSCLAIAPPLVSYFLDSEMSLVQPVLKLMQEMLDSEHRKEVITKSTLENLKSFLDGFGENTKTTSIFVVAMASVNIFLDVFMLIGSCFNISCLILPWLILSMIKLIIVWIPTVIFFCLLGVYLYVQGLVLPSILLLSFPATMTFISLVVWVMVLTAYSTMGKKQKLEEPIESESAEPLIPEHPPVEGTSYNLGQYPQYYPPHTPGQSYGPISQPTAPPQSSPPGNIKQCYPTLPVA